MRPNRSLAPTFGLVLVAAGLWSLTADEQDAKTEKPSDFLRFVENEDGAQLRTSIVTYKRDDGVRVHLVGALHIAEKSYFKDLQKTFKDYDALLYELVGDRPPPPGARSSNPLSMLQRWMKNTLELEFQLDAIDYRKKNFIHADMNVETYLRLSRERGESIFSLMLRAMQHELERQRRGEQVAQITIVDLVRVFLSKNRSNQMKLVFGRQFEHIEATLSGLEGKQGSVILTERNKVAMRVLKETLDDGKENIGIFYGAGHMPDLEKRLLKLGFKKTASEWRVAWNMPSDDKTEKKDEKKDDKKAGDTKEGDTTKSDEKKDSKKPRRARV